MGGKHLPVADGHTVMLLAFFVSVLPP